MREAFAPLDRVDVDALDCARPSFQGPLDAMLQPR